MVRNLTLETPSEFRLIASAAYSFIVHFSKSWLQFRLSHLIGFPPNMLIRLNPGELDGVGLEFCVEAFVVKSINFVD